MICRLHLRYARVLTPRCPQGATAAPLIERSIHRASGIVYTVTGGADVTLKDLSAVSKVISELAAPNCNIIFGTVTNDAYEGQLHVTVIATGFAEDFGETVLSEPMDAAPLPVGPKNTRGNPFMKVQGMGFL
jgi:cell division protein FtsZ